MFWRWCCRPVLKINSVTCKFPLQKFSAFTGKTVDLAYKCHGNIDHGSSQSPVIILHGLLASKNSWFNVSEAIHEATARTVISVDCRNHGESQHSTENTYINMAHDTRRLIKNLGLSKVSLLGHSMSGRTAMVLSLLKPQLISSMIVVDISPLSISRHLRTIFPPLFEVGMTVNFNGITNLEEAKTFAKKKLNAIGVTKKTALELMLLNIGRKPDGTIGWIPNMDALKENFPTLLKFPDTSGKKYPGPVLFIGAEKSDFLPPHDFEGIKSYFPFAQLKYIPGVGHNMHEEDPSALVKFTTDFLLKHNV